MSARRLLVLLALAVAMTAAALWLGARRTTGHEPGYGAPVLPGLAAVLDSVTSLRLVGAGGRTLVTLARGDGGWRVAEADYAADMDRVRRLLVALGELRVVEAKTSDPARYPALGVEDVAAAGAQSIRLELGGLQAPLALLVGRAAGQQGSYVRLPTAPAALEARPALELPRTPQLWLARTVIDLAPERVQSLAIAPANGPPWRAERTARDAAHFDVPDLPRGRELSHRAAADAAADVLARLEFDEVRRSAVPAGRPRRDRTVVHSFDGLVVTLEGWAEGEQRWLAVASRFDAGAAAHFPAADRRAADAAQVRAEAERIARATDGWQYRVPGYRYDAIFRKRDDVLRH